MARGRFSMMQAARRGYAATGRHWPYLLKTGFLPVLLHAVTAWTLQAQRPDASVFEVYLWSLPAHVLFGWFLFVQTRLFLLGERVDRLPPAPEILRERAQAMKLCIVIFLLFGMARTTALAGLLWTLDDGNFGRSALAGVAAIFLIGAVVWGVRFSVAHIPPAAGFPVAAFLRRVEGVGFSLRLIGMGMLCALPVYFVMQLVLATILPDVASLTSEQLRAQAAPLVAVMAPLGAVMAAMMNAGAVFALREVLGRGERKP